MNAGAPYRGQAHIGGAMFFFLRELRWGAPFRVETQAVAIDEKWLYTESRWYIEGPGAARAKAAAAAAASSASSDAAAAPLATSNADVLAAVQVTRFVFKEGSGPLRGKTIPPRDAFRDLGLAVPESFADAARIGTCFTEAFEIATRSEPGLKQEGTCGCSSTTRIVASA